MNSIPFYDCFEKEEKCWVSCAAFNGLFCVDYNRKRTEWIAVFPEATAFYRCMHGKIYSYEDYLFFFPLSGVRKVIDIYNVTTGKFSIASFPATLNVQSIAFFGYLQIEETVWIISRDVTYPILGFQLNTQQFTIKERWNLKLQDCYMKNQKCAFWDIVGTEKFIWITVKDTSIIKQINTQTEQIKSYSVGNGNYSLEFAAYDGEKFWMTLSESHNVICWNPITGVTEEYLSEIQDDPNSGRVYNRIIWVEDHIFLLSRNGDKVCTVDKKAKQVIPIGKPVRDIVKGLIDNSFSAYFFGEWYLQKDKVLICPGQTGVMLVIDINTLEVEGRAFALPKGFLNAEYVKKKFYHGILSGGEILQEYKEGVCNLSLFLAALSGEAGEDKKPCKKYIDYGQQTYNYIKAYSDIKS